MDVAKMIYFFIWVYPLKPHYHTEKLFHTIDHQTQIDSKLQMAIFYTIHQPDKSYYCCYLTSPVRENCWIYARNYDAWRMRHSIDQRLSNHVGHKFIHFIGPDTNISGTVQPAQSLRQLDIYKIIHADWMKPPRIITKHLTAVMSHWEFHIWRHIFSCDGLLGTCGYIKVS